MSAPKTYKAPHAVYTGGKLYNPGEPFTTAEPKGKEWEAIGKAEKTAAEASSKTEMSDPPYEELSLEALKAVAIDKKVNPQGLNKKDLIAAIKAANEPAL